MNSWDVAGLCSMCLLVGVSIGLEIGRMLLERYYRESRKLHDEFIESVRKLFRDHQ